MRHRRLDSNKLQHLPKDCLNKLPKLMKIKLDKNPWVMMMMKIIFYLFFSFSSYTPFSFVSFIYIIFIAPFSNCYYSIVTVLQFTSRDFYVNIIKSCGMEMAVFLFALGLVRIHDSSITIIITFYESH